MPRRVNRAPRYYTGIERGSCGMFVETLMVISASLNMPLDLLYMGGAAPVRSWSSTPKQ